MWRTAFFGFLIGCGSTPPAAAVDDGDAAPTDSAIADAFAEVVVAAAVAAGV